MTPRCTRCGRPPSDCLCGWPRGLAVAAAAAGALLAVRDVVGGEEPGAWARGLGDLGGDDVSERDEAAGITAATRIDCAPLRARIAARQCAALSTRTEYRPLGCLGCALGAEVRAALGVVDPRGRVDRVGTYGAPRVRLPVAGAKR